MTHPDYSPMIDPELARALEHLGDLIDAADFLRIEAADPSRILGILEAAEAGLHETIVKLRKRPKI